MKWEEIKKKIVTMETHYSMDVSQQEVVFNLCKELKKPVMLEVGVCHGRTAAVMSYLANNLKGKYYGIDNWALESSEEEVVGELTRLGLKGKIITADSKEIKWDKPLDVLLIDGGHAEDPVASDCAKFIPWVKPNGLLFMHDWGDPGVREKEENAHWAISYYGDMYTKGWEDVGNYGGLQVKRRPNEK